MASYRFASGFNAFVAEATGQIIGFARNPARYKYNQYAQLFNTPATVGLYYQLHVDDPTRLASLDEHVWEDGSERPNGNRGDGIRFKPVEFATIRKDFPFRIGWKALEGANKSGLKLLLSNTTLVRNQAQIDRTQRAITLVETAGNWGDSTDTADNLNGGFGTWDTASSDPDSTEYLAIKKTLDEVARQIHLKTNGAVGDWEDGDDSGLRIIISPGLAIKMSQTSEIHDYLRESPYALAQIKGKVAGQNAKWGLPDQIYGWRFVVENAVRTASRPIAAGTESDIMAVSPTKTFIKSDDSAVVTSQVGGIDGEMGGPSFSTLQLYYLGQEMELETMDETKHRRTEGHVVIDDVFVLAAPQSGYLIQDVLS